MSVFVFRAGPFVIDAGPRHAKRQLLAWPGLDGAEGCLITHHDEDHVGNAAALADRGLEVRARREVLAKLEHVRPLPFYRLWTWGTAEPGTMAPLEGAAVAGGWQLVPIHTPGHTCDHFVFHEPNRDLVFTGDLYLAGRVPVARRREDVDRLLASLRAVRDLKPRMMFCAHRGPVEDPVERLSAKIEWTEEIAGRARELAGHGMETREITRRLLGREGVVKFVSGGEYSKSNLIEASLRSRCR